MMEDDYENLPKKDKGYGVSWSAEYALSKYVCDQEQYNRKDKEVANKLYKFWINFGIDAGAIEIEIDNEFFDLEDELTPSPESILLSKLHFDDGIMLMIDVQKFQTFCEDSSSSREDEEEYYSESDSSSGGREEYYSDRSSSQGFTGGGSDVVVDTKNVDSFGKYVNDPKNDPHGRAANVIMSQDGFLLYFIALRNIETGEEILGEYGETYWNMHK